MEETGSTWVILNPQAGKGRAERAWPALAARLHADGHAFTQAVTCGPGDAVGLARQAVGAGASRIVVAGGDGTLNEVVNGCLRATPDDRALPTLALLPFGTGVDFARSLGLASLDAALETLRRGAARPIDLALVAYRDEGGRGRERAFINVADFGLGPLASRHLARADPRLGRAAYLSSALGAIAAYRPIPLRIHADNTLVYAGASGLLAVGNARYFGGGMAIAPKARLDDGLLDVVILGDTDRRQLVGELLPRVYRGTHLRHPAAHLARGSRVTVEADEPLALEVDGEIVGTTPARFVVLRVGLMSSPQWGRTMRTDTSGIDAVTLMAALRPAYDLPIATLQFVPKGEESFGYLAHTDDGRAYFVKAHTTADPVSLSAALEIALHLRHHCGLRAVVAPHRTGDGTPILHHDRYATALFDHIDGVTFIDTGRVTEDLHQADIATTASLLMSVHASAPTFTAPPRLADPFAIPFEAKLQQVLAVTARERQGANRQQLVRLLAKSQADIRATLRRLHAIRETARTTGIIEVLTHGDPTAGNIIKGVSGDLFLIDWGAATLGPAERDLVFFIGPQFGRFIAQYVTTHQPPVLHRALFTFYQYLWSLQEIADYGTRIIFEGVDTDAHEHDWGELQQYLPLRHREIQQATEATGDTVRQTLGGMAWR